MKLIILAAGKGERLYPLTRNTPKPLLDMGNGNTLLEEQLMRVQKAGCVSEVVIVIGYLAAQIEAKVKTFDAGALRIRTLFNPFYGCSNNLMSLWLASGEMEQDFMVTNGDNLFSPSVFSEFEAAVGDGVWLAVSEKSDFVDDDMKVSLSGDEVTEVSKLIAGPAAHAESPGLSLVRGPRARQMYAESLTRLARQPEHLGSFWLQVYNELYSQSRPAKPWHFDATDRWQEMDFHQDVAVLRDHLRIRTPSEMPPS